MTSEQNKALMRRFLEASIGSDPDALREVLAPDFVAHVLDGPKDREGFVQHNSYFVSAFSDLKISVEDLIAEGDRVVARITWSGTHSGDFMGLPSTNKQIAIGAFIIERVQDGKTVEHWSLFDRASMMQQLGVGG